MKTFLKDITSKSALQYKSVEKVFCCYFEIYGGILALLSSPYLHISFLLSVLSFGLWSVEGWWDLPISILPGLISFTLAGYAMLTALGNDQFRTKMAQTAPPNEASVFMQVSSSFAHFIIVQTFGLLLALLAKAHPFRTIYPHVNSVTKNFLTSGCFVFIHEMASWFCYWVFLYSCILIIPCAFSIFRATRWFNHFMQQPTTSAPTATPEVNDNSGG